MSIWIRTPLLAAFLVWSAAADDRLQWDESSETVASGPALILAFNNTAMSARDTNDVLHAVWFADSSIWYGRRSNDAAWAIHPLVSGVATNKPTLALLGTNLYAAWRGPGSRVAVTRSTDFGVSWGSTLQLTSADFPENITMAAFTRSNGAPGLVVSWILRPEYNAYARTWQGASWDAADWTSPTQLCASGAASDVAAAASGETLLVVWEDRRNGPQQLFGAESRDAGATWTVEQRLATNHVPIEYGGDPSVAFTKDGDAYVGFQAGDAYLMRSSGSYTNYDMLGTLGPGLFVHAAANERGMAAMVWEYFTGALTNDAEKRIGITVSSNNFSSFAGAVGPFAMPGADTGFARRQPAVSLSRRWLDVFWIEANGATQNLQHQSARVLSPLEGWRLDHFGSPDNAGAGANGNDADGDGCGNLLEYAAGTDPTNAASSAGIAGSWYTDPGGAASLAVTYTAPANDSDVSYAVEATDALGDLAEWLPCSNVVSVTGPDVDGRLSITVNDFATAATNTSRFMRLCVSAP